LWAGLKNAACRKLAALLDVCSVQLWSEMQPGFLQVNSKLGCGCDALEKHLGVDGGGSSRLLFRKAALQWEGSQSWDRL